MHLVSNLKWSQHFNTITLKAAKRLHYLKQLKRSGAGRDDLRCFFTTVICPALEYACPVWHSSFTVALTKALESLQRRALGSYMKKATTLRRRFELDSTRWCHGAKAANN